MTAGSKIRAILRKRQMTVGDLADALGKSRQNMSNQLNRDNFQEEDLRKIADALNCTVEVVFTDCEDNERF